MAPSCMHRGTPRMQHHAAHATYMHRNINQIGMLLGMTSEPWQCPCSAWAMAPTLARVGTSPCMLISGVYGRMPRSGMEGGMAVALACAATAHAMLETWRPCCAGCCHPCMHSPGCMRPMLSGMQCGMGMDPASTTSGHAVLRLWQRAIGRCRGTGTEHTLKLKLPKVEACPDPSLLARGTD